MKKSIIALAVAGAMAAPLAAQADATLYGSMRVLVSGGDNQDLDVSNDSSRIGLKGSVETGLEGVKGIYQFEVDLGSNGGVSTTNTAVSDADDGESGFAKGRLAYVGLTGDFGTVALGQQWTPFYTFVSSGTDMTINSSGDATVVTARKDSVLAYASPNMSGFQFVAAAVADTDQDTGEDMDAVQLAAKYSVAGLTLAAAYHETEGQDKVTGFGAQYSMDALNVAATVVDNDNTGSTPFELAASYNMDATTFIATYYDMDNAADNSGINLEVQHKLGKAFTVYANYENDDNAANEDSYGVGMRVDF